jgi:hypothetical protein
VWALAHGSALKKGKGEMRRETSQAPQASLGKPQLR